MCCVLLPAVVLFLCKTFESIIVTFTPFLVSQSFSKPETKTVKAPLALLPSNKPVSQPLPDKITAQTFNGSRGSTGDDDAFEKCSQPVVLHIFVCKSNCTVYKLCRILVNAKVQCSSDGGSIKEPVNAKHSNILAVLEIKIIFTV